MSHNLTLNYMYTHAVFPKTMICVSPQIEGLKMIVASSAYVDSMRTSFLHDMGKAVTVTNEQTSIHRDVSTKIHDLKVHCT